MFRPSEDDIELTVADEALATLEQGKVANPLKSPHDVSVKPSWNQLELIMFIYVYHVVFVPSMLELNGIEWKPDMEAQKRTDGKCSIQAAGLSNWRDEASYRNATYVMPRPTDI